MPTLPSVGKSKNNDKDTLEMLPSIKRVMDYGRLSYYEALELPCDIFLLMVKHSTIEEMKQSEEGRKYLADCERLSNTSIDLDGLIETFGEVR